MEKHVLLYQCKGVHCVDLGENFQTRIYLQTSASIQPRTSPSKFGGKYSILFTGVLSSKPQPCDQLQDRRAQLAARQPVPGEIISQKRLRTCRSSAAISGGMVKCGTPRKFPRRLQALNLTTCKINLLAIAIAMLKFIGTY